MGIKNYAKYTYTDNSGKQQVQYFSGEHMQFRIEEVEAAKQKLSKEVNIAAASANLVGAGMMMRAELQTAKVELTGGYWDLNPTRGANNCPNCAFAADLSLKGMYSTATNVLLDPKKGVNVKTFFEAWGSIDDITLHESPSSISKIMNGLGEGATGVIFAAPMEGTLGHFFNVTKRNGVVQFIDTYLENGNVLNPATIMKKGNFKHLLFKNTTGLIPNQTRW